MTIPVEMSFFTILETNTPHSGLCCENALVPSIGSITQVMSFTPFVRPVSSPRIESSGNSFFNILIIFFSTKTSISVTTDPSGLVLMLNSL